MNFLDIQISIYHSVYDKKGRTGTLRDFLEIGFDRSRDIDLLRRVEDKKKRDGMKVLFPCATISGTFSGNHSGGKLIQHSGHIALDIDHVDDCHKVITLLSRMDIVAYAGRSISGRGVFAIVPIAYPDKHEQQWEALRRFFATRGLTIDPQTKDVSRLRFCSYDPEARYRMDATPFKGIYVPPRPKPLKVQPYHGDDDTEATVSRCCRQIEERRIDLTDDYGDWLRIGFALAELGESGRQYFHIVSSQCAKYKHTECDRKFDECLRTRRTCGIGYFFNRCKERGIVLRP